MIKTKKAALIFSVIVLLNIGLVAFAQETIIYNENDMNALKNILYETENNTDVLNWDLNNPENIGQAEWDEIDGICYLISLDFSNTEINGDIDLTDCIYLETCIFSNTDINSVQLPAGLANIENNAFENCTELQVITINADQTSIGSNAFSGCVSLKSIVNAEKIISIGRNAFHNCEDLTFCFSDHSENEYVEAYADSNNFSTVGSVLTDSYGYAGRMYSLELTEYDLNSWPAPYLTGNATIYTADRQFIETVEIDKTGKFIFENLTIGQKYRLVIDGDTAIPREKYFVPTQTDYCIAPITNCLGILVCDYNGDGIFNNMDLCEFNEAYNTAITESNLQFSVYDFNCDGFVNATDTLVFSYLYYHIPEKYAYE